MKLTLTAILLALISTNLFALELSNSQSKKLYKIAAKYISPDCNNDICELNMENLGCTYNKIKVGYLTHKNYMCIILDPTLGMLQVFATKAKKLYKKVSQVINPECEEEPMLGIKMCFAEFDQLNCIKKKRNYSCTIE